MRRFHLARSCFFLAMLFVIGQFLLSPSVKAMTLIDLNFNSGQDDLGFSQGNLVFYGAGGLQVTFTDDDSSGGFGGNAQGVHISNENYGNTKVGSTSDLVLGAFNSYTSGNNYHSSGIVAKFNYGVEQVQLFDTDDDTTSKTLFAFDELGALIGQTSPGSRMTFMINTSMTGGTLIHKVEFDTLPGSLGGSFDGIYFTVDDFHVEGTPVPLPGTLLLLGTGLLSLSRFRKKLS